MKMAWAIFKRTMARADGRELSWRNIKVELNSNSNPIIFESFRKKNQTLFKYVENAEEVR